MTNSEMIVKCLDGIDALRARQKALAKEHTERIKGLQKLERQVRHAAMHGQMELTGKAGISLSPELQALLENPIGGL